MAETLYASFVDPASAEKAAGALLDHGVRKDDLSLVQHETRARDVDDAAAREYAERDVEARAPYIGLQTAPVSTMGFGGYAPPAEAVVAAEAAPRADLDSMDDDEDLERDAKSGLSTTTSSDAEAGALKGAGVGLGLGVVAGLASLFVPGVGLVTGAGMLAAAVGAAAGTTVAGAVAGGVVGYLKDQGVPEGAVMGYQGDLERGGAMIAVRLPSGSVDEAAARRILAKYGGNNVAMY